MSIVESPTKTPNVLWRTRWDNEYNQLDVAFAKLLKHVGVGIDFVKLPDKPAIAIMVSDDSLYQTLNTIIETPEYATLSCAFIGEDNRQLYENKTSWDNNFKAQVEAFYWRRHTENLDKEINASTLPENQKRKLEVEKLGSAAMIDKILRPRGLSELSISDIQKVLLSMFEKENQTRLQK